MANTVVTIRTYPGLTLTAKFYAEGSATELASVSMTETARAGTYNATVAAALAGDYEIDVLNGTNKLDEFVVTMADDVGPYYAKRDISTDAVRAELATELAFLDAPVSSAGASTTDIADAVWDEATAGHTTAGTYGKAASDILADTNELQTDDVPGLIAALNDVSAADILATALTESYAADGSAATLTQLLYMIQQHLGESAISGTTKTVKKLDGSTTAGTFTLDDATTPTSITRAT